MNAQAAALVLVRRATTWGAVVELPPKPKGFPCVNAQVDKSRFPGGCFDVDAPLLEGLLEDIRTSLTYAAHLCLCPRLHDRANYRNQIREIEAAGFQVKPRRIVTDTVSGSTAIAQRCGFPGLWTSWNQVTY